MGITQARTTGGGLYLIKDDSSLVDDGGSVHNLTNGLKAKLIVKNLVNPEMYGAYGDNTTNDTKALNLMFNSNAQYFKNKNSYKFTNISVANKELINISGGKFEGHFNFNNCNKIILENIDFISGNNNFDEIINFLNCKKIVIKNCKFNGKLIKETTKGVKVINTTDFECLNSNFDNFDGKTEVNVLPNGNSVGKNTRNSTAGISLNDVTNILINKCNFYNILGRSGIYIENCSNIEITGNNFNFIYGSGVHIGNYYKIINIKNNYLKECAITGVSSNDFLFLNGGQDGAIDVYGAENYFHYLANDSIIEIDNNYFYNCGTRQGFSTDYYVYTDTTKTTLATHYSNGDAIGTQPLNVTTKLQCMRILNSYKANIHDNLIVNPHNRILFTESRMKYSPTENVYTFTNNNFLIVKSNKIILNDFADFYLHGVRSVEFLNNTIEAFSTNSPYISTDMRDDNIETTKFLVTIDKPNYCKINGNLILSDVFSGIHYIGGSYSNINDNYNEVWSFGIYVQDFGSLNMKNNQCIVGHQIIDNPTTEEEKKTGGIYINQTITTRTTCLLSNNISPLITKIASDIVAMNTVDGINDNNLFSNSGTIFSFATAKKIFEINTPIDDKYYIEYANGTRKEFDLT